MEVAEITPRAAPRRTSPVPIAVRSATESPVLPIVTATAESGAYSNTPPVTRPAVENLSAPTHTVPVDPAARLMLVPMAITLPVPTACSTTSPAVSDTLPVTLNDSLSVNAKLPFVSVNEPRLATEFEAPVKVADPADEPVSVAALIDPLLCPIVPAEVRSSTVVALRLAPNVRSPDFVLSAKVAPTPESVTGPLTRSDVALVSAKPAVVVKAPRAPMLLVAWPKLAPVAADPVRLTAVIEPEFWLIAPADTRSIAFAALTLPARVRSPLVVVSAKVLPAPVSLTGPLTSSDWLLVNAKPPVVLNAPRVPTVLVAWVRLADIPAPVRLPVRTAAVIEPDVWLIVPAEIRSTILAALTLPPRVRPPVVVVSAKVVAAPVSLTGPVTVIASLLLSAKPAPAENAARVAIILVARVRLAEVCALPVRIAAAIEPPVWLIAPADTRLRALVALTTPARVRSPLLVVSVTPLVRPVSFTLPFTSSAWPLVSEKPALVVNAPNVPIALVTSVRLAEPAPPPNVLAVSAAPAVWVIEPWASSSRLTLAEPKPAPMLIEPAVTRSPVAPGNVTAPIRTLDDPMPLSDAR